MSQESEFIQLIYKGDIIEIYKFLKKTSIKPFFCKDEKGYTALHVASLNGTYALFEFLITFTKRNYKDWIDFIQEWVNELTDDGFSALHFAAHRGNLVKFT